MVSWLRRDKIRTVAWGALIGCLIVYFISIFYPDIWITYNYGMLFLDCLHDGNIFRFYEISLQYVDTLTFGATYFIPIYIIFAVWDLPVWLITRFLGGGEIDSIGSLLWAKGIILVFAFGCVWMMYLILKKLKCENLEYAVFLFISSLFFVCPSMAMIQYDVIELFFILCGIYCYFEDEKLFWRSLLFFSIAISIKLFAIFIFILLVLITEKRVVHIIIDLSGSVLFTIITMLPFWENGYQECSAVVNQSFFERLFTVDIPGGISGISIFGIGFGSLCVIAHLYKTISIQKCVETLCWLSVAFFLLLFAFVTCNPQWIVLVLPFLICVLMKYENNFKINMILEIILESALILVQGTYFTWVYFCDSSFSSLLFRDSVRMGEGICNLSELLERLGVLECIPGIYAVFVVCGVALLGINNPYRPFLQEISSKELIYAQKGVRVSRIGLVMLYFVTTCAISF